MREKSTRDKDTDVYWQLFGHNGTSVSDNQLAQRLPIRSYKPESVSGRLKLSAATILAQLEAENTALRNRAVELALHIQRLAERPR